MQHGEAWIVEYRETVVTDTPARDQIFAESLVGKHVPAKGLGTPTAVGADEKVVLAGSSARREAIDKLEETYASPREILRVCDTNRTTGCADAAASEQFHQPPHPVLRNQAILFNAQPQPGARMTESLVAGRAG